MILDAKGDLMEPLTPSQWLLAEPALSNLADYLRDVVAIGKEIDEKYFPSGSPLAGLTQEELEAKYKGEPLMSSVDVSPALEYRALYTAQFCEADRVLRLEQVSLSEVAEEILRLYDDKCENSGRTLQYVEALLTELDPNRTQPGRPVIDGPMLPDAFCWEGKKYSGLQPIPMRLVFELWDSPNMTRDVIDLQESVWGDSNAGLADNALRSAQAKGNKFFCQKKLSFRIKLSGRGRYTSLAKVPPPLAL